MDVLLGSIDVRDLLSSGDLDPSSPLSAPDLRLLIDRLNLRSLHIKARVRDYVLAHRDDFSSTFARCSEAASRSDDLAEALADALRLLSDHPVDLEIRDLAAEIAAKRRELEERKEALGLVRIISGLVERLEKAREDLRAGRFVTAAEGVRDLKEALLIGDEGREDEPTVYGVLRKEWVECLDELQEVLARNVERAVQFEVEGDRVTVRCWSRIGDENGIELRTVLEAMEIVGVLDYGLARVADLMVKHVMVPAVSKSFNILSLEDQNQDAAEKAGSTLTLIPPADFQECLDGAAIYSRLGEVMKFIHKFICLENSTWVECFGRLSWPRLSDLIITSFLSKVSVLHDRKGGETLLYIKSTISILKTPCLVIFDSLGWEVVPHDASKAADFENVIKCTTEFEAFLKEMMFISKTAGVDEKLSDFAHNVEVHFASRKRNEILAKARNILLQCDYAISPENSKEHSSEASGIEEVSTKYGVDLLFQGEICLISKAASQLMALVHDTLKDACFSSTRVAREFYHAARDALFLYKAIVPIKLEKQLDTISQTAIVIHNDFVYLAQEILGLAFEYRADFPSGSREKAIFLDIAPNFCQMAKNILHKQTLLVRNSLKDAIDGANGFQNTHQSQQYELAKFSTDQVVFTLEKVHIMWEPLMPASTYKKTMSALMDSVFSEITKDMLLLDDMAAEETLQLQRLIQFTLESLYPLLESLLVGVGEKERHLENNNWASLDEMIPSLRKFRKLADLFDMPLKSITTTWETGELVDCGFTSSEVENFVKAVFTDSPLRKECLWRIANTNS